MLKLSFLVAILFVFACISWSKNVLELEGTNFELTITAYRYLAVLFYDDTNKGQQVKQIWKAAGNSLNDNFPEDCEVGMINGEDPELKEIIDAYAIATPAIRVFRHGIIGDYRGPVADSEDIASYLLEDAKPSVQKLLSLQDFKEIQNNGAQTSVFGFFKEEEMVEDDFVEGYPIDSWGQFLASADVLRGHAKFYAASSAAILKALNIKTSDLPIVIMLSNEGEGFLKYNGEILEMSLSEWILRNSAPLFDELTISTAQGELYATQFFSSRKLKFILFGTPTMLTAEVLERWEEIAHEYAGTAIFSYMTQSSVADVVEYFDIDINQDLPMIAAHQPTNDGKYKSSKINLKTTTDMENFVSGVIEGKILRVLKSEPLPKQNKGPVIRLVGKTLMDSIRDEEKDVLLVVYAPWCQQCKKLLPTIDMLGKAVQGESRIMVAKIDGIANDIPPSWNVKNYPALLWFPVKDKPYAEGEIPLPRPYWDAGFSLQELIGFVQRESSFDMKTLKIATIEQIGSLLADEEVLREKYEEEERNYRRNEGRVVYQVESIDWLLGEVVYDGKRWHLAALLILATSWIGMLVYIVSQLDFGSRKVVKTVKKKQ